MVYQILLNVPEIRKCYNLIFYSIGSITFYYYIVFYCILISKTVLTPGDHTRDWWFGTKEGEFTSMGVISDGSYNIPAGIIYSFPVYRLLLC